MGIYLLLCKLCVIHVHALIIIKYNINRMHNIIIYNLKLKYYNSNPFRLSAGHLQGVRNYTISLFKTYN
jgi:hypothetical protein